MVWNTRHLIENLEQKVRKLPDEINILRNIYKQTKNLLFFP